MSDYTSGIPPYEPERDSELEIEATMAQHDDRLQMAEEPILSDTEV